MKKLLFFFTLFFLLGALDACKKNPFYGVSQEDVLGPEIYVDSPSTAATQIGTFNLIGHAKDIGGDNTVLKIEVSLDGGTTWNLANGTVNWSYTVDSLSAWGVIKLPKTIIIKATDTDYKKNTSTISITYNIDNTNPSLIGSITDTNDTVDYNGAASMDGFHQSSETATVNYRWKIESGVLGYEINLYNSSDNKTDIFVKNNPSSNGTYAYAASEINNNTAMTTGISNPKAIRSTIGPDNYMSFSFDGVNGKKYYAAVKPYDSSLNRGPAKISVEETIDTLPPAQVSNFRANSLLDTAPNKNFNSALVTFSWNASSDAQTAIRYYKIDIKGDASIIVTVPGDVLNYTYDYSALLAGGTGTFNARIEAVDMAGNWSAAWSATADNHVNFYINTNSVSETLNPLKVGSNYQNSAAISFTWTASAAGDHKGYDIQILRNDGKILALLDKDDATYFTVAPAAIFAGPDAATGISTVLGQKVLGTVTLTFTGTNSYTYQIQVKSYNTAGTRLSNWESSDYILIDTNSTASLVPANLRVKGISSGNVYHNSNSVRADITWDLPAATSYSGIAYYQVDLNNDSSPDAIDVNCGSSITNIPAAGASACFADGTYSNIKVRAVNRAGTVGNWLSPGITLAVDTQIPNTPTGLLVAGTSGTIYYSSTGNRVITWTNNGDNGTSGISYFQLDVNGTLSTFTSGSSYNFSANGTYILRVRAVDNAGNASLFSASVTVIVNTGVPSMPANFKIKGSGASPIYYNSPTSLVSVTWDHVTDISGISHYIVHDSIANGIDTNCDGTGETTNYSTGSDTASANLCFTAGSHNITVYAVNNASVNGTSTAALNLIIDNQAPNAVTSLQVGGSGTTYIMNAAGAPSITWGGGADNGSAGLKTTPYELLVTDLTAGSSVSYFAASSPYSGITFSANKQYTVQARSWDKAENAGSWSNTVTVIVDTAAPAIPSNLKVSNSTGPLYFNTAQTGLFITWDTVTSDLSGIQSYQISLDGGTTTYGSTSSNYLIVNFPLAGTAYQIKVQSVDKAGNPSGWSAVPVLVYVENTPPAPDPLTVTSFTALGGMVGQAIWPAGSDALSGLDYYEVLITKGPNSANVKITVDGSGNLLSVSITSDPGGLLNGLPSFVSSTSPFQVNFTFNTTGTHSLQIRAFDKAGNGTGYSGVLNANIN